MKLILIIFLFLIKICNCANILCIIPIASYSHQIPYRPLWRELHARGHHLTILTTDPMNDPKLTNITEINLHFVYDIFHKHNFTELLVRCERGVLEMAELFQAMMEETINSIFQFSEVQDLINNPKYKFDLLILEQVMPPFLAFGWKFNCPWISVNSLDAVISLHHLFGNPVHPIVYPDYNLQIDDLDNLSFSERLLSFFYVIIFTTSFDRYFDEQTEKMKPYFGEDLRDLKLINRELSAMFINVNPIYSPVRPVTPNTVLIGDGIHIQPPRPLPKDIQNFLDNAENGAIYFSLGSNIRRNLIDNDTLETIITTLNELQQYRILWKFDLDDKDDKQFSKHIMIRKWFPQQDILRHPNIKLFITQGGLQSLQEALVNQIPLVCLPFFGDQFQNVQRIVKKGVGVKLDRKTIDKTIFKQAVIDVVENPKYKEAAVKNGKLLKDAPLTGLEQAVWWTEYILRHKGAPHLRNPAIDMPFYQYYCLDIIAFVLSIALLLLIIVYKLVKFLIRICVKLTAKKQKIN